jgi:hypothetical protein
MVRGSNSEPQEYEEGTITTIFWLTESGLYYPLHIEYSCCGGCRFEFHHWERLSKLRYSLLYLRLFRSDSFPKYWFSKILWKRIYYKNILRGIFHYISTETTFHLWKQRIYYKNILRGMFHYVSTETTFHFTSHPPYLIQTGLVSETLYTRTYILSVLFPK